MMRHSVHSICSHVFSALHQLAPPAEYCVFQVAHNRPSPATDEGDGEAPTHLPFVSQTPYDVIFLYE